MKGSTEQFIKTFINASSAPINVKLYTHSDLDGAGCAIMMNILSRFVAGYPASDTLPINCPEMHIETVYCDNPSKIILPKIVGDDTAIVITDLCPTKETLSQLDALTDRYVIVDHHIWNTEQLDDRCIIDSTHAATLILHSMVDEYISYMMANLNAVENNAYSTEFKRRWTPAILNTAKTYATDVSKYDTGDFGEISFDINTKSVSSQLKESFYFEAFANTDDIPVYVTHITDKITDCYNTSANELDEFAKKYVEQQCRMLDFHYKLMVDYVSITTIVDDDIGEMVMAYIPFNVPSFNVVAQQYLRTHPAVDILIGISNKHGSLEVRLRSFGDTSKDQKRDCQRFANKYGGGGHKNAAGFTVPCIHQTICLENYSVNALNLEMKVCASQYTVVKNSDNIDNNIRKYLSGVNALMSTADSLRTKLIQENSDAQLISCKNKYIQNDPNSGYIKCTATFSVNKR